MLNMRVVLLVLAVSLVGSMPFEKNENTIKVDVRDISVEDEGLRTKRETGMSRKKKFEIGVNEETVILDLELNNLVNEAAPMYVMEGGKLRKWEIENTDEKYGFYQDRNHQASIMVKCRKDLCKPIGTFSVKDQRYNLNLEGKSIESVSLLSPIERPPKVNISREGDAIIVKVATSDADGPTLTQNTNPQSLSGTMVPDLNTSQQGTDIIEIMVYTDEAICNRFIALENDNKSAGLQAIRSYYSLLVNEMDTIYQPFRSHPSNNAGLDIRLFLSGIVIACDSAAAPWSHYGGDSFNDIVDFASWQLAQKTQYNFQYDFAMAISAKMKDNDLGIAFLGKICSPYDGVSVIYEGISSTWLMTTSVHELGHSLGAAHDQDNGCPDGYLMYAYATSGTESTAKTQYEFSPCSVDQIQRKITSLGPSRCTLKHNFDDTQYDEYRMGAIGGEVFSVDYQCQLYYGSGSYACSKNSSTMCYSGVYCQTSTGCDGIMQLVKERTECDSNKWCVKGQCVDKTTSGTDAPGDCFVYKTCKQRGSEMIGDGCCQGSVTTECCVYGNRTNSCTVQVRCP